MAASALIERWFPQAAVGAESLRERGAFTALPPTNYLHVWWARRPLITSRAAVVASLLPAWPTDEDLSVDPELYRVRDGLAAEFPGGEEEYQDWFVRSMGILGNPVAARVAIAGARAAGTTTQGNAYGYARAFETSPDSATIERIIRLTCLRTSLQDAPVVLDPFAGGGSIPLEAARYGCDTIANELNPVASAILAATVQLPIERGSTLAPLLERWGRRWSQRIAERLDDFFPREEPTDRLAYVWAHTIPCPQTGFPTPLMPNSWLATADGKRVAVEVRGDAQSGEAHRCLVTGDEAARVGPTGTYKGGNAISIYTGQPITGDTIRTEAKSGRLGELLLAVVVTGPEVRGRVYRLPTAVDYQAVEAASDELARELPRFEVEGLLPTEAIERGKETARLPQMGLTTWRSMFTERQLLAHAVALEELHRAVADCRVDEGDEAARALALLLTLCFDKSVDYNGRLASYDSSREKVRNTFDRHDFAFKHTFAENDAARMMPQWALSQVISGIGGIVELTQRRASLLDDEGRLAVRVLRGSAADLGEVADTSVDAVVTDPPYYDNVIYSECSDYFYVWLKRSLRDTWPRFCDLDLTEKQGEAVANPALYRDLATHSGRGRRPPGTKTAAELADEHYERLLADAWREAHRVLKPDGVLTVMFTHKRVDAWDTLGASLLAAGFSVHSSWPVHTESEHSLHQAKKNSASSTILLTCRKRGETEPGYWADVRGEVTRAAREAAKRFADDGLTGVDLTVSTFGPVLRVLSHRWPVRTGDLDDDGEPVILRPDVALDLAREEVAKLKKQRLLNGRERDFDRPTDWWLLAWEDFKAAEFPAGEALKLSLATHLDLDELKKEHRLITTSSGSVKLLSPKERRAANAFDLRDGELASMVDALHALMVVYDEDGLGPARQWLAQRGLVEDERFEALVQAAVNAVPRAKVKEEFAREEARILDGLCSTIFTAVKIPEPPGQPEEQLILNAP